MVTNAELPDPGLSIEEQAEMFARSVIGGHPNAAIRRIILWTALFVLIGLTSWVAWAGVPALLVATLLVSTDGLL